MKYRVSVKEIWVQGYTVEANSKAHAKHLVETALKGSGAPLRPDPQPAQSWGMVGPERWDVQEIQ